MFADIYAATSLTAFWISAASSALFAAFGRRLTPSFFVRANLADVQAIHETPTPRLGGVGVMLGISVGGMDWFDDSIIQANYWLFLVSLAPVVVVGLIEDVFGFTRPYWRLAAAALSGIIFVTLFGQWLPRIGVPGVDWVMAAWPALAIVFTVFACTGVTHAVNLIDGVHGLSGMWSVAACISLALVAQEAGLEAHVRVLVLFGCAVLGFLIVNYPLGKIFLGDAGAYTIGNALAWTAVSIIWLSADVAPFALLLIFLWPVVDTLYAIARRLVTGRPVFEPDLEHMHHVVFRILLAFGITRRVANPFCSLILLPAYLAPMAAGIYFWNDNVTSTWIAILLGVLFVVSIRGIARLKEVKEGGRTSNL